MKLGADGIFVELAGEAFELRPSLRASMRLVRRHGLTSLLAAVQGFSITIILDVLKEAAIKPSLLLAEIAALGLGTVRNRLTGPLAEFVLAVAGIDPDDATPSEPAPGKPVDPERAFAQLFGIATGALGWTPEAAWNATPAEIIAAYNGQTAHLIRTGVLVEQKPDQSADHYTPERLQQIEELGHDPAFDRNGLATLKGKL
ncbi:phage tail assembly chaperone [Devosia sp. SL43]|uniref:phage tail assembly chaperone n=1 Tax=Devosia sp. SL43 TaxID=2806348 RepID=UPI001F35D9EC|nr:phage tail assembly chaperone [Devosia sp. SL43]UJW85759.1 phage tail assembly chaperone [Devosia sp. SL43]